MGTVLKISPVNYPKGIEANFDFRVNLIKDCQDDKELLADVYQFCKHNILFWIDLFCWTKDPRKKPDILPFICYESYQEETILEIEKAIDNKYDCLIEKSRDMGVSWMVLYVFMHKWLFEDGSDFRVGSRKEEFVDKVGDIDTLFEKVRFNLGRQPLFLMPKGFQWNKHSSYMKIINPQKENAIIGESANENFGTGGRRKAILLDEFSKWESRIADAAWTSTADVSKCRLPVSCIAGCSIIYTKEGMKRIKTVQSEVLGFAEGKKISLYGRYGMKDTTTYYNSGVQDTLKFTVKGGYKLETSLIHPLLVLSEKGLIWKKAEDIEIDDYIAIQYGQECFGDSDRVDREFVRGRKPFKHNKITPDLAYLMGLLLAEGYIHQGHQIIISSGDEEIHEWLETTFGFSRSDEYHSRCCNSSLCDFFKWFGFVQEKSPNKVIPDKVLGLSESNIVAFLQGMFDGDGSSFYHNGYLKITYTSTSQQILDTLQSILLNFGILSSQYWHMAKPSKIVKVESFVGWLELNCHYAGRFMERINFRLKRKKKRYVSVSEKQIIPYIREKVLSLLKEAGRGTEYALKSIKGSLRVNGRGNGYMKKTLNQVLDTIRGKISKTTETYKLLNELNELNVTWREVKEINRSRNSVYDFHIEDGHSFTANGFIGHNTPKGSGNKFALLAKGTKEKIRRLSLHWTLHPEKAENAYVLHNDKKIAINTPQEAFVLWKELRGKIAPIGLKGGLVRSPWYDSEALRSTDADLAQEKDIDYHRSGFPFFDLLAISKQTKWEYTVRNLSDTTIEYGKYIRANLVTIEHKMEIREIEGGWLKIYELPSIGKQYILGGDVSEGLAKGDESFGVVRDKQTRNVVATFNGLFKTDDFAIKVFQAGKFYNNCKDAVENNNHGHSVNQDLKVMDCDLYWTKREDKDGNVTDVKPGWTTTSTSRPLMLDQLEEETRECSFEIRDGDLIDQTETFIKNEKTGKPEADGSFLDDGVIALAIAGRVIREYPYKQLKTTEGREKVAKRRIESQHPVGTSF